MKLMYKELSIFKGLFKGDVSINYIDKGEISKTPRDTTMDVAHNQKLQQRKMENIDTFVNGTLVL